MNKRELFKLLKNKNFHIFYSGLRHRGVTIPSNDKEAIDITIDLLKGGEKKTVPIFHLRSCGEVAVSWGLNGAGPEIDT